MKERVIIVIITWISASHPHLALFLLVFSVTGIPRVFFWRYHFYTVQVLGIQRHTCCSHNLGWYVNKGLLPFWQFASLFGGNFFLYKNTCLTRRGIFLLLPSVLFPLSAQWYNVQCANSKLFTLLRPEISVFLFSICACCIGLFCMTFPLRQCFKTF